MPAIAALLTKKRGLRKGLSVDTARDIWIYNDHGLHHALAGERRWDQDRYRSWLTDTLRGQLMA